MKETARCSDRDYISYGVTNQSTTDWGLIGNFSMKRICSGRADDFKRCFRTCFFITNNRMSADIDDRVVQMSVINDLSNLQLIFQRVLHRVRPGV